MLGKNPELPDPGGSGFGEVCFFEVSCNLYGVVPDPFERPCGKPVVESFYKAQTVVFRGLFQVEPGDVEI